MRKLLLVLAGMSWPVLALGSSPFCDPQEGWGPTSELTARQLVDFENPAAWQCGVANQQDTIALASVSSPYGPALHVAYDLPNLPQAGDFVYLVKPSSIDIAKAGRISFWLRGEGLANKLDFKVSDADGGIFLRSFPSGTKTSGWRKLEIDMAELIYTWGGSNSTPEPPFKLDLAIAKAYCTRTGGNGWIELAQLEQLGAQPHLQLLMNQIGFDPEMTKQAVVQLLNHDATVTLPLEYQLLSFPSGKVIETGQAPKFQTSALWPGQYWVIPFGQLAPNGQYTLKVTFAADEKPLQVASYPFAIQKAVLAKELSQSQFHYIHFTRYPLNPRHQDPLPGGYIDTEFDIEKWMTTTPTWVWAMASWQRLLGGKIPAQGFDPLDEIRYAARFCLAMQDPASGGVYIGVGSTRPNPWETDVKVEADTAARFVRKTFSPEVNGAYSVTMVEVAKALENKDPQLAKLSLQAAIRSWNYLDQQQLNGVQNLGMFLWASTQLFAATQDPQYLNTAKVLAQKLFPMQFLDYHHSQEQVFGVFFEKPDKSDFIYQYKFVHSIGIYLGLIELAEALPANDPLQAKLRFHLDCFAYGFIKRTAELNPFGKVAQALEPPDGNNSELQLYYFASPKSPIGDHGLNCDLLSMGLIALRYARFTQNPEFAKIAVNQISWVLGSNPMGFCMVSGKGTTNPHVLVTDWNKGPVLGGIPNGFISPKARNKPQWMTEWNSEEYWKPHNAMLLALMTELESGLPDNTFSRSVPGQAGLSLQTVQARADHELQLQRLPGASPLKNPSLTETVKWELEPGTMEQVRVSSPAGKKSPSLRLDYTGNRAGNWAQFFMSPNGAIQQNSVVELTLQSSQTPAASLEVKVVDEDGSVFITKRRLSDLPRQGKTFKLAINEFTYAWGGNQRLDRITKLEIAVALTAAAKGFIVIQEFAIVK